jgi:hypothetical protein
MAGSKLSDKSRCDISYSDIEKNREEFLELVSEPRFICRKCLRIAVEKKNLCKGKKLKAPEEKRAEKNAA